MRKYSFTVVIPAHNEEKYVARCIRSVKAAAGYYGGQVEIIVVCNRCTDRTAEIALQCGAKVLYNEERCIAGVRNTGIAAASGEVVVTIDCDNRMTKGTLQEIALRLATGLFIGGGAPIRFERYSFPLYCNDYLCRLGFGLTGLYCGIFWAKKETFEAIGGFTAIKAMEDVATARQLKRYGKQHGLQYTTLRHNYLINSTRKFDDQGDWLYFKLMFHHAGALLKAAVGDRKQLDVLAVGAYDGDKLVGLAGCSADADEMWQIGVDVLPEYRRNGIASAITSRLALEILERDKVPFYCTAWSNIRSVRNAVKSGLIPAWAEMTIKPIDNVKTLNL